MAKQRDQQMDSLHRDILSLCTAVEEMIDKAALVLTKGRLDLVDEVAEDDKYVNQQEVIIENECLRLLALHQPVAADLRRIATVVKVNNDLERIGDLAVSITQRAMGCNEVPEFKIPDGVGPMFMRVTEMLRGALDSFVNLDAIAARQVIEMDDVVDDLYVVLIGKIETVMRENSSFVPPGMHCFSAIRHLERIGDLATNIAEDVIFLVEGEIVRHQSSTLAFLDSSYVQDDCIDN